MNCWRSDSITSKRRTTGKRYHSPTHWISLFHSGASPPVPPGQVRLLPGLGGRATIVTSHAQSPGRPEGHALSQGQGQRSECIVLQGRAVRCSPPFVSQIKASVYRCYFCQYCFWVRLMTLFCCCPMILMYQWKQWLLPYNDDFFFCEQSFCSASFALLVVAKDHRPVKYWLSK